MFYFKAIICLIFGWMITSCSYFYSDHGIIKNRDSDYMKAKNIAPLAIPPGLSSSSIEAHYPIADKAYPPVTKSVDLIPPGLNATSE